MSLEAFGLTYGAIYYVGSIVNIVVQSRDLCLRNLFFLPSIRLGPSRMAILLDWECIICCRILSISMVMKEKSYKTKIAFIVKQFFSKRTNWK